MNMRMTKKELENYRIKRRKRNKIAKASRRKNR